LGDQGAGSILGLMWRLAADLEFGEMEKGINIMSGDIDKIAGPFWFYGLKDLDAINNSTYWSLKTLQDMDSKTAAQGAVNVAGTDLSTVIVALNNINTTLQFNVGLNPWFQTAIQNINNGIVACAGWLQGILNLFQSGAAKVGGSSTTESPKALADLATFIGANFTDLENWLFNALGRTMALPALPPIEVIPPSLAGGTPIQSTQADSGSTLTAHAVSQSTAGASIDPIAFLTTQFSTLDGIISKMSDGLMAAFKTSDVEMVSLGGLLTQLTSVVSTKLDSLIAAVKPTISLPTGIGPSVAFAGSAAAVSGGSSGDIHLTISGNNFHGTAKNLAQQIGTELVNELRRRNRLM
jgi:hypothetical protein